MAVNRVPDPAGGIQPSTLTTTGDILYASGAQVAARLGIGSSAQVLTVASGIPSWATPSSTATSYTLLNSGGTAMTGSATITISSISGINKLFCIINNGSSASASSNTSIRLNGDTTSAYGYFNGIVFTSPTIDNSASTTQIYFGAFSTNAASQMVATIEVDGCNSSGIKTISHSSGTTAGGGSSQALFAGGGTYNGASTISSISFISGTGNWDAGTVYVYGA